MKGFSYINTIDDAIEFFIQEAVSNEKILETGILYDDVTIDEFYADDTEIIDEHLLRIKHIATNFRNIANWLIELKEYRNRKENLVDKYDAIAHIQNLYPGIPKVNFMRAREKWYEEYNQFIQCEEELRKMPSVKINQQF